MKKEILRTIEMPEQKVTNQQLLLPESAEYTVSLLGTNNDHIVDEEGRITRPLVEQEIAVDLAVTIDGETMEHLAQKVLIPGVNAKADSVNPKPIVVPELSEWFGYAGEIDVDERSRIVLAKDLDEQFHAGIEEFVLDFHDLYGVTLEVLVDDAVQENDLYFASSAEERLGEEGYIIQIDDGIRVTAQHETGMYWATRTLLQILVGNDAAIPKGEMRDYPKWDIRGFMLDVGRKTISMQFLKELSKQMAWYKLNDFHIHLNDNYIFLEDYTERGLDPFEAYSGFRLESSIDGLTSEDVYYTKEAFAELMKASKTRGVQIVPEIDVPAHSLALTQARPDLAMGNVGREADHLDLTNPDTLPFVKEVLNEYLEGEDPLFTKDTVVHVGTDEYDEAFTEEFRQFTDDMLGFIQDDHQRTVRLWGSLTARPGKTPVRSEGVQMNIWSADWTHPQEMYDQGYDLINTLDSALYIVPDAGYYRDYLAIEELYDQWEAHVMDGIAFPVSSPQLLGGAFAVWNDQIDLRNNGIAEIDIYDRIDHAMPILAAKLWGSSGEVAFADFQKHVQQVGPTPRTNLRHEVASVSNDIIAYDFTQSETQDFSENRYDMTEKKNVDFQDGLVLTGGASYLTTPLADVALGHKLLFRVKQDAAAAKDSEQILFEQGTTQIKASQNKEGKLGFSREGLDYVFAYELPKDEWVDLALVTEKQKTSLYVNGKFVEELRRVRDGQFYASMNASLLLPIKRIGSQTDAFQGKISNVCIVKG